jgi:hypothetical protein
MTPDLFSFSVSAAAVAATLGRPFATAPAKTTRGKRIRFTVFDQGEATRVIEPYGRDAWMCGKLVHVGGRGITTLECGGAPRVSGYIHKLRHIYGLQIASIDEMHDGPFAGRHVRYKLMQRVEFADSADAARRGSDQ